MRTLAYSFAVLLTTGLTASAATYESKPGGYEVNVPSDPIKSTKETMSPLGKMTLHLSTGQLNLTTAYTIVHVELPPIVLLVGKPDDLLDGAEKGISDGAKATVTKSKKINLGKSPGKEIVAEALGGTVIRAQVFVHKGKMYQVMIITPKGNENSLEADAFFDSFKLK